MRPLNRLAYGSLPLVIVAFVVAALLALHLIAYSGYRLLFASELPGWPGYAWYVFLDWVGPLGMIGLAGAGARTLALRLNATAVGTYVAMLFTGIFISHIVGLVAREWATALVGHAPRILRVVETSWDGGTLVGVLGGVLAAAKRIWSQTPEKAG